MSCNSDYLKQTLYEEALQKAAINLEYVYKAIGVKVPLGVRNTAREYYAKTDFVPELCAVLKNLKAQDPALFDKVVFGKTQAARDLATWWEEHLNADAKRKKQAASAKRRAKLIESAQSKLTKAEWEALVGKA